MSLARDDSGFTLIELLITIVITGIIVSALAAATISILHNSNATTQRLTQSHDAQMAAAFFANDVQSSDVSATVGAAPFATDSRCDQGNNAVVRFAWTGYDTSNNVATYTVVSYNLTAAGSPLVLRRSVCQGTGANAYANLSSTPISNVLISSNVSTATAPTAQIVNCASSPTPKTVSMTVTEQPVPPNGSYVFQVSGTRREASC